MPYRQSVAAALGGPRFVARVFSTFALVALLLLWLAVVGLALGLAGATASARFLSSPLFGVGPTDTLTLSAAAALLLAVSLLASALPARRALRVHPAVALREQ